MQRTNYWNQTRPTDTQLNWTETSKSNAISQRLRSSAQMGIAWGFAVTVNPTDNTKIDVGRGEGYSGGLFQINEFETAGSAQRISTYTDTPSGTDDTGPAAIGQALADYTAGVANYVSLVYGEITSQPLAERTYPFNVRQTVVTETFTVSVLTVTQWNALGSAALNNRILVGIVTAQGAGTALTSANIDQFVQPKTLPTTSQPQTILGTTVVGVADTSPLGIGTLRWDPTINQMFWTAPGDAEGTGLVISDSGVFTVYSSTLNYYIALNIVWGSLSLVAVAISENLSVQSLYGRAIPMFSAVDQIHRDMVGSGQPSVTNPHAMTLADIGGGTLDHADLFHVNGISKDADTSQLECQIDAINDRIQVTSLGGYENSFLIDGKTLTEVTGSPYVNFDITPIPTSGQYLIYIDNAGGLHKVQIGDYDDALVREFTNFNNLDIWDIHNLVAGTAEIEWAQNLGTSDGAIRYKAPGDAFGDWVQVAAGVPGTPATGNWGIYKVYSSDTDNWIILQFNGAIGVSNTETFTTVQDETDYAAETMLKLCVVSWNATTEQLTNLRDIRRFVTADNRTEFEEEHDEDGAHTKTLRNIFRVYTDSEGAVDASADSYGVLGRAGAVIGVYGYAADTAVYGSVPNDSAGYFKANDATGVYGSGVNFMGGYFRANNIGLFGTAVADTGAYLGANNSAVVGSALVNTAGHFKADGNIGVYGLAVGDTGGYFKAANSAVVGSVLANTAAYYKADVDIAVYGTAVGNTGGYLKAANSAVVGSVLGNAGGYFKADVNVGVYGTAVGNTGGYFKANNSAVVGSALVDTAGHFKADGAIAVYGSAPNTAGRFIANVATAIDATAVNATAIYASAPTRGIRADVAGNTAMFGSAVGSFGLRGDAGHLAGFFAADSNWAANEVIGLYCSARNPGATNSAVCLQAYQPNSGATGIAALALHAADGTAIYASADSAYGVWVTAKSQQAIYAQAPDRVVYAVANVAAVAGDAVYGLAQGSLGAGVYGLASESGGIGVRGSCSDADGQAGGSFKGAATASVAIIIDGVIDYGGVAGSAAGATAGAIRLLVGGNTYGIRYYEEAV